MGIAMFRATPTLLAIHPIHVWGEPISRHKCHALLDLLSHGIHLTVAWTETQNDLALFLADSSGESELPSFFLKSLRIRERLPAVNCVLRAFAKITGMRLGPRIAPLAANPIRMPGIIMGAGMVCDLLHVHVPFIHVELRAATHACEALRIAIIVLVFTGETHWHIHEVEIQVAAASWSIIAKIDVHCKSLADIVWHVEVLLIAVICGWPFHEVEPVGRLKLDGFALIDDCSTRQIVRVHHPVLIDCKLALLRSLEHTICGTQERSAVEHRSSPTTTADWSVETPDLHHGCVSGILRLCCTCIIADACAGLRSNRRHDGKT